MARATFTGSPAGEVTGTVIPVDINLAPPRETTSGCEASDFDPSLFLGENDIALIQRGGPPAPAPVCTFGVKAANAEAAGAEAVIIFNQRNTPEREGLVFGTLGDTVVTIPLVAASSPMAQRWPCPARRRMSW